MRLRARRAKASALLCLALALACQPRGGAEDVDAVTKLATEFLHALDADPASA